MPDELGTRVYALATALGLKNKDVLDAAEEINIVAKSHSSPLTQAEAEKIANHLGKHASQLKEERLQLIEDLKKGTLISIQKSVLKQTEEPENGQEKRVFINEISEALGCEIQQVVDTAKSMKLNLGKDPRKSYLWSKKAMKVIHRILQDLEPNRVRIEIVASKLSCEVEVVEAVARELGLTLNDPAHQVANALGIGSGYYPSITTQDAQKIADQVSNGSNLSFIKTKLRPAEQKRRELLQQELEAQRQKESAEAQRTHSTNTAPPASSNVPTAQAQQTIAQKPQKMTGSTLVQHCLKGLAEGVAETSICIRAGYKTDDIGQFRRAFSREAKVALAPLNRMAAEMTRRNVDELDTPTSAVADREVRTVTTSARVRNAGFRAGVLARHGARCVCCGMALPELVEAAHIVPVANDGSDSPSNGLPLCPTHHSAFDRHLFSINPDTLEIQLADGLTAEMLQITESRLHAEVSEEALRIRWEMFLRG